MDVIFLRKTTVTIDKQNVGKVDDAKSPLVLYHFTYHFTYIKSLDSTYLFNEPLELHHHGPNAPRAPGGVMAIPKDPKNDLWSIG